jgi:hypothetical protein
MIRLTDAYPTFLFFIYKHRLNGSGGIFALFKMLHTDGLCIINISIFAGYRIIVQKKKLSFSEFLLKA